MQLNAKTDYAIRMVVYLAAHKGVVSAQDLSAAVGITTKQYVFSIVNDLRGVGLIASARGVNGGFYLAKAPEEITLWDITMATESTMQIAHTAPDGADASGQLPEYQLVGKVYETLQYRLESVLKFVSIADILRLSGKGADLNSAAGHTAQIRVKSEIA